MKYSKKQKTILFIVLLLAILLFVFIRDLMDSNEADKVCIENNCFNAEVVSKPADRQRGLMFRQHLDEDSGMLFIFDESGIYSFWMKNTLIPLDMIWINEDMHIVSIKENALPCEADPCPSITPTAEALYVFEVNSGTVAKLGISQGDEVKFK